MEKFLRKQSLKLARNYCLAWNPKVHYYVYKPPLVPILSPIIENVIQFFVRKGHLLRMNHWRERQKCSSWTELGSSVQWYWRLWIDEHGGYDRTKHYVHTYIHDVWYCSRKVTVGVICGWYNSYTLKCALLCGGSVESMLFLVTSCIKAMTQYSEAYWEEFYTAVIIKW